MSDDFYSGPSVLAPGAPRRPDALARWLIWPLLLILFLTSVLFYVVFSPLRVVGDSMVPTLLNDDRVLRTKSYPDAHRGDVVVIDSSTAADTDDVIKRVVAVAGDVVEVRGDVATINGLPETTADLVLGDGRGSYDLSPITVPEGHVYVLGDNRPVSLDSRYLGPVPMVSVRGRASFVFFPLNRMGPVR